MNMKHVPPPYIVRRAGALIIDAAIFFGITWLVWNRQTFAIPDDDRQYSGAAVCLLFVATAIAYFAYFSGLEAAYGQTLGKFVTDVRVVTADGKRASFGRTLVRHLFDCVDAQVFGLVGILLAFFTATHQRLGDVVAGTRVIRASDWDPGVLT